VAEHPQRQAFYLDCLRRTFAEALVMAGSVMLDVAASEIGVTFHAERGQALGKEVILFDTAPGGAGYSQQMAEQMRDLLDQAAAILEECSCGDSCYRCLRTYYNQPHHRRLDRTLLAEGLRAYTTANWG
jgi:ATP-dependent helicase YprA (DUF1998 family)